MQHLQSIEQFEQLKQQATVFVFSAGWCPDCTFIDPFMPEVEAKFSDYTFIEVNRDDFIDLCQQLDVFGIPSFVAFKDGAEVGRFVNRDRKTQEQIEAFITNLV